MRTLLSATVVLLAIGCAPPPPAGPDPGEVQAAIDEVNARLSKAFNDNDPAGVAACYTEDGVVMAPNAPALRGRANIEQGLGPEIALVSNLELTTKKLEVLGDTAIEEGTYTVDLGPIADRGKYVVIWKNVGGQWLLHYDVWNSDQPLPGAPEE